MLKQSGVYNTILLQILFLIYLKPAEVENNHRIIIEPKLAIALFSVLCKNNQIYFYIVWIIKTCFILSIYLF